MGTVPAWLAPADKGVVDATSGGLEALVADIDDARHCLLERLLDDARQHAQHGSVGAVHERAKVHARDVLHQRGARLHPLRLLQEPQPQRHCRLAVLPQQLHGQGEVERK